MIIYFLVKRRKETAFTWPLLLYACVIKINYVAAASA